MPARGIHFRATSLDTLKQFCASPETSVPSNRSPRVLLPVVAVGGAGVFRADVDYGLTGRVWPGIARLSVKVALSRNHSTTKLPGSP
jgi:hypothetical protein